jgi:RecG-like helicase
MLKQLLGRRADRAGMAEAAPTAADAAVPIAEAAYRARTRVAGRVRAMRIQPWGGAATLECTLVDNTGGIVVVFLGRRNVPGITVGSEVAVEGMVGESGGRLAMLNPDYWLLTK